MRTRLALLALTSLATLAGCYRAFDALEPRDGGARSVRDAAPSDTGADGGHCDARVTWLDPATIVLPATESPIALAGAQDRIDAVYLQGDPSLCDGPCVVSTPLPTSTPGPSHEVRPFYWASEDAWLGLPGAAPRWADARRGSSLHTLLTAHTATRASWQWQLPVESSLANGTFVADEGRVIGDVLPAVDRLVLLATHEVDPTLVEGPRLRALRVHELYDSGEVRDVHAIETGGAPFAAPRLAMANGASQAWVAYTQRVGSGMAVQISEVGGTERSSGDAGGCDVRDFDVAADAGQLYVVEDCSAPVMTRLAWRTTSGHGTSVVVQSADVATSIAPSRLLSHGLTTWVVYAPHDGGSVRVSGFRFASEPPDIVWLERIADFAVPPAPELDLMPISRLAIARSDDGTIAVGWSVVSIDPVVGGYPRAAIARFTTACE